MGQIKIEKRMVPDPSISDSEFLFQQQQERERAERKHRRPRLDVGMVLVEENAITRIGALCFIRRREAHQERAAETFKSLYEARYGSGNPAMDPSRVQVDTSPIAHDSGMAAKIDRTYALEIAEDGIGKAAFDRLVALLILCVPVSEYADKTPSGRPNDRQVRLLTDEVLTDLDSLARVWRLLSKAA